MNCHAYTLGKPCRYPGISNTPYCQNHTPRPRKPTVDATASRDGNGAGLPSTTAAAIATAHGQPRFPSPVAGASREDVGAGGEGTRPQTTTPTATTHRQPQLPSPATTLATSGWSGEGPGVRAALPPTTAAQTPTTTLDHAPTTAVVNRDDTVVDRGNHRSPLAHAREGACAGTNKRGKSCNFNPARGEPYCLNHKPGANPNEIAHRASRASAIARAARIKSDPSTSLLQTVLNFNDRTNIQSAIDVVTRLYIAGRIDEARFRALLYACSTAVRNFDRAPETVAGPTPQKHDKRRYWFGVQALLKTIDPLILAAADPVEDGDQE